MNAGFLSVGNSILYFPFHFQMDHIKEKLSKITPSIWKCHLRSTSGGEKKENASSPDVTTACYLSLEPPSENFCKTDTVKKSTNDNSKVNKPLRYLNSQNVLLFFL